MFIEGQVCTKNVRVLTAADENESVLFPSAAWYLMVTVTDSDWK